MHCMLYDIIDMKVEDFTRIHGFMSRKITFKDSKDNAYTIVVHGHNFDHEKQIERLVKEQAKKLLANNQEYMQCENA